MSWGPSVLLIFKISKWLRSPRKSLAGLKVPTPSAQTNSTQQRQNQPELATIAYRSRAVKPFSEEQLHDLMVDAQVNNRKSGLTGLLIYDEGKFFQWIEGHPD